LSGEPQGLIPRWVALTAIPHTAHPADAFSRGEIPGTERVLCLAAGAGSVAVAFDKDTGAELWRALSAKEPGMATPWIENGLIRDISDLVLQAFRGEAARPQGPLPAIRRAGVTDR
jgi:hypothetical protein